MGMNRKLKRNKSKNTSILDNLDLNFLMEGLGLSEKVGDREPYSSGRITERIADSRPTENELLEKFSKSKLENEFESMTKFTELYSEFEELFVNDIQAVDIKLMNETWSLEKIVFYFNQLADIGLDCMNNMCDLASYAKNKEYSKLQERILEAEKEFNPRMIGVCTRFEDNPENMSELILKIRAVQNRYMTGAAFLAIQHNMPIETIEDRTKALLEYNKEMKEIDSSPMGSMSNLMINESKSELGFAKKTEIIANNIINDNSIKRFSPVINGGKKQVQKQTTKVCELYNKLEDQLEILQEFLNEDKSFNFEKAKLVYKNSGSSLGSVELYLESLKNTFEDLLSVNRTIFELYLGDRFKEESNSLEVLEEYGFDTEHDTLEEAYNSLLEAIKLSTGHFYLFAKRKSLAWNNETDIMKTNNKFLKEVEKYGLDRKIERPTRKKNLILEKLS